MTSKAIGIPSEMVEQPQELRNVASLRDYNFVLQYTLHMVMWI